MLKVGKTYDSNIMPSAPQKSDDYNLCEQWIIHAQLANGNFLGCRSRYYPADKFPVWIEFKPDGQSAGENSRRRLVTTKSVVREGYTVFRAPLDHELSKLDTAGCCGTVFYTKAAADAWCDELARINNAIVNTSKPRWRVIPLTWVEEEPV